MPGSWPWQVSLQVRGAEEEQVRQGGAEAEEARLILSHPLPRPAPGSTSAEAPSSVRTGWSPPPTVGSGEAPLHLFKGTTFTSQPQAGSGSGHGAARGQGAGGGSSCSPPAGRTTSRKSHPPPRPAPWPPDPSLVQDSAPGPPPSQCRQRNRGPGRTGVPRGPRVMGPRWACRPGTVLGPLRGWP